MTVLILETFSTLNNLSWIYILFRWFHSAEIAKLKNNNKWYKVFYTYSITRIQRNALVQLRNVEHHWRLSARMTVAHIELASLQLRVAFCNHRRPQTHAAVTAVPSRAPSTFRQTFLYKTGATTRLPNINVKWRIWLFLDVNWWRNVTEFSWTTDGRPRFLEEWPHPVVIRRRSPFPYRAWCSAISTIFCLQVFLHRRRTVSDPNRTGGHGRALGATGRGHLRFCDTQIVRVCCFIDVSNSSCYEHSITTDVDEAWPGRGPRRRRSFWRRGRRDLLVVMWLKLRLCTSLRADDSSRGFQRFPWWAGDRFRYDINPRRICQLSRSASVIFFHSGIAWAVPLLWFRPRHDLNIQKQNQLCGSFLSHITRKCVFGDFRPGLTQTGLLSYSDKLESWNFRYRN